MGPDYQNIKKVYPCSFLLTTTISKQVSFISALKKKTEKDIIHKARSKINNTKPYKRFLKTQDDAGVTKTK